jgi:hypothetical protein
MNTETITIIVSVISAVIAFISVIFARRAVERADKTLSMEVITHIFTSYSSVEMNENFVVVWKKYLEMWQGVYPEDPNKAAEKVFYGVPVSDEAAQAFYDETDPDSEESRAVDSVLLFWLYVSLLVSQKILDIEQLSAFMTPRILGFLDPIERAKARKFGYQVEPKSSLQKLNERWKKKYPQTY